MSICAAKSVLGDESFDMCVFQDDPLPLGNRIRSDDHKVLIRT